MSLRVLVLHASYPAFIWIYLMYTCTRCEAQPKVTSLPDDLDIDVMKERFCNNSCNVEPCQPGTRRCLCSQICRKPGRDQINRRCWTGEDNQCEPNGAYSVVCNYLDAVICRNRTNNFYCVFCTSPSCTTLNDSELELRRCFEFEPITVLTTTQVPKTTKQANSASTEGSPNVATSSSTIALACVLSVVLLLVILGAGVWYLRRRGILPAFMNKSRNPNESATELEIRTANRPPIPIPPALGSAEYSYAYGQNKNEDDDHYYSTLDKDGGEESARYVKDGPGSATSQSTEAPNNHDYFVLHKSDEGDSHMQDGDHSRDDSSPEEDEDHTYFPLQKTPERPSGNANSGYEAANTVPTGGNEGEDASSPYNRLERRDGKQTDEGAPSDDYQHLEDN